MILIVTQMARMSQMSRIACSIHAVQISSSASQATVYHLSYAVMVHVTVVMMQAMSLTAHPDIQMVDTVQQANFNAITQSAFERTSFVMAIMIV